MVGDVGPTWREITVGKSTADDVVAALGMPTSVERRSLGQIAYLFQDGDFDWAMHRVIIRGGIVQRVEEDVLAYPYDVSLSEIIDQYGTPDYVLWSKEGPELRIAVFLKDGVLVSATALPANESQATRIFYFRPRSIIRLLVDFRDEISIVNPFPSSDVVGPRDPWSETS